MILERISQDEEGTFGILTVDDFHRFYTVERPWLDNQQFVSCVPPGEYKLVPHRSHKYGDVLALVNEDMNITHWEDEGENNRYAILIHVANYPKDVQGCIGLGTEMGDKMVLHSKKAIKRFYKLVDPTKLTHTLRII